MGLNKGMLVLSLLCLWLAGCYMAADTDELKVVFKKGASRGASGKLDNWWNAKDWANEVNAALKVLKELEKNETHSHLSFAERAAISQELAEREEEIIKTYEDMWVTFKVYYHLTMKLEIALLAVDILSGLIGTGIDQTFIDKCREAGLGAAPGDGGYSNMGSELFGISANKVAELRKHTNKAIAWLGVKNSDINNIQHILMENDQGLEHDIKNYRNNINKLKSIKTLLQNTENVLHADASSLVAILLGEMQTTAEKNTLLRLDFIEDAPAVIAAYYVSYKEVLQMMRTGLEEIFTEHMRKISTLRFDKCNLPEAKEMRSGFVVWVTKLRDIFPTISDNSEGDTKGRKGERDSIGTMTRYSLTEAGEKPEDVPDSKATKLDTPSFCHLDISDISFETLTSTNPSDEEKRRIKNLRDCLADLEQKPKISVQGFERMMREYGAKSETEKQESSEGVVQAILDTKNILKESRKLLEDFFRANITVPVRSMVEERVRRYENITDCSTPL